MIFQVLRIINDSPMFVKQESEDLSEVKCEYCGGVCERGKRCQGCGA